MELIALLIAFLFFCEFVVPLLRDAVIVLASFLGLCIWEVLKLAGRLIAWLLMWFARAAIWIAARLWEGTVWTARQCGRGAYLGLVFIFYLADEWRRGPREEEAAEDTSEEAEFAPAPQRDAYAGALARFGLAPGFTQADLRRAYKQAIKTAHPDAGGSDALAQTVNTDRDLIARRHGWK